MVDDPHRQVTNPAHRYLMHLNAPGWNVAGATEAPLAGRHSRPQRPRGVGSHGDRHRPGRRLRRDGEPGQRRTRCGGTARGSRCA